jgi:hypothetical protein
MALADGTEVNSWPDSSGQGLTAIKQGPGGLYYNNVLNGKPVVRFIPPAFYAFAPAFVTTSGWTCFVVMKPKLQSSEMPSLASSGMQGQAGPLTNGFGYYIGVDGNWSYTSEVPDNIWRVLTGTSSPSIRINGKTKGISTVAGGGAPGATWNTLGERAANLYADGDIAEIVIYQGVLPIADQQLVENYLMSKYAIVDVPFPPVMPVITGLANRWRASNATPQTDGATVTSVRDEGSGGMAMAGTTGVTLKTNILNGQPVLRFDGAGVGLSGFFNIGPSTGYTVVVVAKASAITATADIFSGLGGGGGGMILLRQMGSSLEQWHNDTVSWVMTKEPTGIVVGEWNIFIINWDLSNCHLFRNGVAKATSGATLLNGGGGNGANIGRSQPGGGYFAGDVAEVITYNNAISTADRHALESYLSYVYGIGVTPGRGIGLRSELKEAIKKELNETGDT